LDEIAVIQISGKGAWWHCVVATRLLARDAKRARERPQGNFDAGRKLGGLLFIVEIEVLHLSVGKATGELSEQSGDIEIRAPWSRNDLLYLDLQGIARLRPVDEDRARQRHRPARRPIRAQFLQLLDGAAWIKLTVRMRHRLDGNRVARIDD
jgi:hypothetical protein